MDQSEFDIAADLPHRGRRSQATRKKKSALVRVIDGALPDPLLARARRAIARLGRERFRESYFTTFWLPKGAAPAHVLEEAVIELSRHAGVRCAGMEWWIGRAYTTRLPIEFHFDQDVKGGVIRHPLISSVLFFNRVRGGHLAVTDATWHDVEPKRLETVKPRRNRYAIFPGNLWHGVLDARGSARERPLPGPRGRLRVTLVVNFWKIRPTSVPLWSESKIYRRLKTR